jgi:hypothetical protein
MSLSGRLGAVLCAVLGAAAAARAAEKADPPTEKVIGIDGEKWTSLFDGKQLGKWEVLKKSFFDSPGKVQAESDCLVLSSGQPATGIRWSGEFPKIDYELALEARRVEGNDFFCGLTFPVEDKALTLIMGGWGGWLVGLSCLDGFKADENETSTAIQFEQQRWYHVRLRVTKPKITVWIDDKETIVLEPGERKLSVSWEMEPCQPLGVATWYTTGSLRNIQYRTLDAQPKK